jgi:hypothetical protein
MRIPRVHRFTTTAVLAATAVLSTACDELSDNPTPAERADVIRTGVELGTTSNNRILRAGHSVRVNALVTDEFERPLDDVPLLWSTSAGGGSVAADSGYTGTNGMLGGTWTAGTTAGVQEVIATVDGGSEISNGTTVIVYADTVVGTLVLEAEVDTVVTGAQVLVRITSAADRYGNPYALSSTQPDAPPPIEFASLDPSVATLILSTARTAVVRAHTPGTARVVARSDGKADTVNIHVIQLSNLP